MGLIPHVSFYISNLLLRVLNYGWNLPDMALSYISLPPSSHLDPSGFIILCEDHLVVSKPCPTTWKSALIFISEGFWRAEILGGGNGRIVGQETREGPWKNMPVCLRERYSVYLLVRAHLCIACASNSGTSQWFSEMERPEIYRKAQPSVFGITFFYLIFYYFFRGWGRKIMLCVLSPG